MVAAGSIRPVIKAPLGAFSKEEASQRMLYGYLQLVPL